MPPSVKYSLAQKIQLEFLITLLMSSAAKLPKRKCDSLYYLAGPIPQNFYQCLFFNELQMFAEICIL